MRISDIIHLGKEYLLLGIMVALVLAVAFCIGYFVIYKKLLKGKKRLNFLQVGWLAIFVCYIVVVLGATLLSRGNFWGSRVVSLFYTYKDAWVSADASAWRNIVLNILLFVPLGFLLPLGVKRFRSWVKTYLVGFVFTLAIEVYQLVFSAGIFEVADLINNTLGAMIGYGIFAIVEQIICLRKKEKGKAARMLLLQLPLLFTIILFSSIYIAYQTKELGNLQCAYIEAYDADKINVEMSVDYSDETINVMVYQVSTLTVEETRQMADDFFERMGTSMDESRIDIYDETAFYWAKDSYDIVIDYLGGTYSITDFDTLFGADDGSEKPNEIFDAREETIRETLAQYDIEVPTEATFTVVDNQGYRFDYEQIVQGDVVLNGTLTCTYYDNGKCGNIDYRVVNGVPYKEFAIISEQEACERIIEGKFPCVGNQEFYIKLGEVSLEYQMDSKGFYQPVYAFSAEVNGQESKIVIPAIQ